MGFLTYPPTDSEYVYSYGSRDSPFQHNDRLPMRKKPHTARRYSACLAGAVFFASFMLCATSKAQTVPPAAPCDGGTATEAVCSGDVSAGVSLSGGGFSSLTVENLTNAITPGAGNNGIEFTSVIPIELFVDSGNFGIATTGGGAGIFAASNGMVTVTTAGGITTDGDGGDGILAGSNADLTLISSSNITTNGNNARGITASTTPNGMLSVTSNGVIDTTGNNSQGIFASNISGDITVIANGTVSTNGTNSDAILGGSINGNVNITANANITADGSGAAGISASSSSGNLAITVNSTVTTLDDGTVIELTGGVSNTLVNNGIIGSMGTGDAVSGGGGDESIINHGHLTGNVDLGGGTNSFTNASDGLFTTGAILDAGLLANAGIVNIGGPGSVITTAMTGDFNQAAGGKLVIDIDGATTDLLQITGAADLAGSVQPQFANITGPQNYTFLTATGGVTDSGLALLSNPALNAVLTFNANDVMLSIAPDFSTTAGLGGNQSSLAMHFAAVDGAGGGGLGPVLTALLNTPGAAAYGAALDQLSPEAYAAAATDAVLSAQSFSDKLMSCRVRDGAYFISEGECIWSSFGGRMADHDRSSSGMERDTDSFDVSFGAQKALQGNWHLGGALGYTYGATDFSSGASNTSHNGNVGLALKYTDGPVLLAGSLSGGIGAVDTSRPAAFGAFTGVATADFIVAYLNQRFRAAYDVPAAGGLHIKPMADIDITGIFRDGIQESGVPGANLRVESDTTVIASFSPSLEFGREWQTGDGMLLRPFLRAGATVFSDDSIDVTSRFDGTPAGVASFSTSSRIDQVMADVGAGFDLLMDNDATLRLNYEGHFGSTTMIHAASLKAGVKF